MHFVSWKQITDNLQNEVVFLNQKTQEVVNNEYGVVSWDTTSGHFKMTLINETETQINPS